MSYIKVTSEERSKIEAKENELSIAMNRSNEALEKLTFAITKSQTRLNNQYDRLLDEIVGFYENAMSDLIDDYNDCVEVINSLNSFCDQIESMYKSLFEEAKNL